MLIVKKISDFKLQDGTKMITFRSEHGIHSVPKTEFRWMQEKDRKELKRLVRQQMWYLWYSKYCIIYKKKGDFNMKAMIILTILVGVIPATIKTLNDWFG